MAERDVTDEAELIGELRASVEDASGAAGSGARLVAVIGVTNVVGKAKVTLAPCAGEVTGTGAGTAGAVEEFMAESSHAWIQP